MNKLRKMRIEKGYSIKRLSLKTNISVKKLRKLETESYASKKFGTMIFVKIAKELECNLSDIQ